MIQLAYFHEVFFRVHKYNMSINPKGSRCETVTTVLNGGCLNQVKAAGHIVTNGVRDLSVLTARPRLLFMYLQKKDLSSDTMLTNNHLKTDSCW